MKKHFAQFHAFITEQQSWFIGGEIEVYPQRWQWQH